MNPLDRLARTVALNAPSEAPGRLTRRDLVRRGGAGALSLGALIQLGIPGLAAAARKPCPTLKKCLNKSNEAGSRAYRACRASKPERIWDEFLYLDCLLWDGPNAARDVQRQCFTNCSNPPKQQHKTPPPPPPALPPNPYAESSSLCANCASVGGVCCFGGWGGLLTPGGLCACATPGVECRHYGC